MNTYQLTLVVKNDIEEKERQEILTFVSTKVNKINKEDLWGVRDLAYPLKHQKKAYYAHLEFDAEADQVRNLDKLLNLNEDIIRYLLVKK